MAQWRQQTLCSVPLPTPGRPSSAVTVRLRPPRAGSPFRGVRFFVELRKVQGGCGPEPGCRGRTHVIVDPVDPLVLELLVQHAFRPNGVVAVDSAGTSKRKDTESWPSWLTRSTGSRSTDAEALHPDASNFAAFPPHLCEEFPAEHQQMMRTIRSVAPFFRDFVLTEDAAGRVPLRWEQVSSDTVFPTGADRSTCMDCPRTILGSSMTVHPGRP